MKIRKRQAGLTTISWIILLVMVGFIALFAFKLMPLYMDYMTVNAALGNVAHNEEGNGSAQDIRMAIAKQFNVNEVSVIDPKDVQITADPNSNGTLLTLDYDARTGFVANIDLLVHFHKVYKVAVH